MDLKKTPLHEWHIENGAKMTPFCGWDMPVRYSGLIEEHLAVRQRVGLFDVSHMGRVLVEGKDAERFLDFLGTAKISGKKEGACAYTLFPTDDGKGTVDDLLVYREDDEHFFLVVNASRRVEDLNHLQKHAKDFDVTITPCYDEEGIIAVQGPLSVDLLGKLFPEVQDLKFFRFMKLSFQGSSLYISRTGYTGELGFECIGKNDIIAPLWEALIEKGQPLGVLPIGLGARDTLRLEKGFALYGHELSEEIAPHESIAAWAVNWKKERFLGKDVMESAQKKRCAVPLVMEGKDIPREGYRVFDGDKEIGMVTSGTRSPSLEKGIALAVLDSPYQEGKELLVEVRKRKATARVTSLPFS